MRDDGEPISRGRLDRNKADAQALGDALRGVALLVFIVLVNGILAILLIGFAQAVGWWEVSASDGAESAASELSSRWRLRAAGGV